MRTIVVRGSTKEAELGVLLTCYVVIIEEKVKGANKGLRGSGINDGRLPKKVRCLSIGCARRRW
jgi:hypothetical protein